MIYHFTCTPVSHARTFGNISEYLVNLADNFKFNANEIHEDEGRSLYKFKYMQKNPCNAHPQIFV